MSDNMFGFLMSISLILIFLIVVMSCKKDKLKIPEDPLEKLVKPEQKKYEWIVIKSEEREIDLYTYNISIFQKSGNVIKCQFKETITQRTHGGDLNYNKRYEDRYEQTQADRIDDYIYRLKLGRSNPTDLDGTTAAICLNTIDRIEYKKADVAPIKGAYIFKVSSYKEVP